MIIREQAERIAARLVGASANDPDNGWDLQEFDAGWLILKHATRNLRGAGFHVVERESGRVLHFPSHVPPSRILEEYDQVVAEGFPEDSRSASLPVPENDGNAMGPESSIATAPCGKDGRGRMTIPRISADIEKPFRDAVGHALRNEFKEMRGGLLRLTDDQIASCLNMCAFVGGYVAINACGRQWPDEDNLRRIADRTTQSESARAFGLKAEDSYAYVRRVALRGESLDTVFSPIEDAATLSFAITGYLLVAFRAADQHWWEYLDKIEETVESALAADLDLLPALMLRSRRLTAPGTAQH